METADRDSHPDTADALATLALLSAVEAQPNISQRGLARRLGAALGLTNAYFKRAVRKGYIKVTQAPARRFFYYLTPLGFIEKARLTQEYLTHSLAFFRRARAECDELVAYAANRGWHRLAVYGASDLAEIVSLSVANFPVRVLAVIDPSTNVDRFAGHAVVRDFAELGPVDAVIVADVKNPQAVYDALIARMSPEAVLHPALLHIVANGAAGGHAAIADDTDKASA